TEYISCAEELPKDGIVVMSKIADEKGERNEQLLKRQGNLWFVPSGDMYVYYRPTHWRSATTDELLRVRKEFGQREDEERRRIEELDHQIEAEDTKRDSLGGSLDYLK